jgi:hypothetical protein
MPNLPWNRATNALSPEERSFEALLSGAELPTDAPAETLLVADLVSSLGGPAMADELGGFTVASAAYRRRYAASPRHHRTLRWRPAMLGTLAGTKIVTALAAGAVALGGLGAAAYAGTLPDSAQDVAHNLIGAPSGHGKGHGKGLNKHNGTETGGPVGPDATGPAAYGLCTAYEHAKVHGQSVDHSVAFANLAEAAGGANKIDQYCASIPRPSGAAESAETGGAATNHATSKPKSAPTSSHPAGKPSTVPTPAHPSPSSS